MVTQRTKLMLVLSPFLSTLCILSFSFCHAAHFNMISFMSILRSDLRNRPHALPTCRYFRFPFPFAHSIPSFISPSFFHDFIFSYPTTFLQFASWLDTSKHWPFVEAPENAFLLVNKRNLCPQFRLLNTIHYVRTESDPESLRDSRYILDGHSTSYITSTTEHAINIKV